jgi:hypothetical protein
MQRASSLSSGPTPLGGFLAVSDRHCRLAKRKAFAGITTEVRAAAGAD